MKHLVVIAALVGAAMPAVSGQELKASVISCRAIEAEGTRLACFDRLAKPLLSDAVVGGLAVAGTLTGEATYSWQVDGDYIEGTVSVAQSKHTGKGALFIDMPDLPHAAMANTPVQIRFEGLVYTSSPYGFVAAGSRRIYFRESASGLPFVNIAVPAAAASYGAYFRYRWR